MTLHAEDRDPSVDPGTDFYRFANGGWMDAHPIPAGFEVINPKLAAGGQNLAPPPAAGDAWAQRRQAYWNAIAWDHQELRDDRVLWFADDMQKGTYELAYQARATIDGTFRVMPATVEAMYFPEVRGRTDMAAITIAK